MSDIIRFGAEVCADLDRAAKLEWLETNGIGGFASSTIAGMNTRRYHGLLVAATKPPVGRIVMLSKLEETLVAGDARYDLSANRYPGVTHPAGFRYLREFRLDPFPVFVYQAGGVTVEKRVFMVNGENTVVVEYEIEGPGRLDLHPLIAFRDYHSTTHQNGSLNPTVTQRDGVAIVAPYEGLPPLYLAHNAAEVGPGNGWYLNFEYDRERDRGLDFREDLYNPLVLHLAGSGAVIASTELRDTADAPALRRGEIARRKAVVAGVAEGLVRDLTAAADQFIVQRGDLKTVIAGYHWFCDWGRDTMISLPGLTLATGRYGVARQILEAFADTMDQGMLPNRFPDAGETPEYNTVDATLWFFEAARAYVKHTGDTAWVFDKLYAKLKDAIEWHVRGTRYGIHVDADGLLTCGQPGVQLTWMDAKVGDWVVTPREGKPVEIQALWYHALRIMQGFALRFDDHAFEPTARELADRARRSFRAQFWNAGADCLFDVVNGDARDAAIRPNQIFAVSLAHSMLDDGQARRVIHVVERDLLTSIGLRTLAPTDPQYRPRYQGGVVERDSAYHQGTVWPWLMGPFVTAYVKVHGDRGRVRAAGWLSGFRDTMRTAGLGHICEVADGDAPHTPGGCIAQAWSVAELLRAAVEDVGAE